MYGYLDMLKDLGVNQELLTKITNSGNVIEFKSNVYYKDVSNIHGIGVFALKDICKSEIIGLGSLDSRYKTILGRFTNHSDNNNAMFYYLENNDVIMVAEKNIVKGKEILVNYRDHVLHHNNFKK